MGKLTVKAIEQAKTAKKYFDGQGLYLHVQANGTKYWRGKYRFAGKEKLASYGSYPQTSLKEAREAHFALRAQLSQGIDPMAERKAEKAEAKANTAASFARLAGEWFEKTANARQWGEKHRKKIRQQLDRHILPVFGKVDCREIRPKEISDFIQSLDAKGINTTAHDCFDIIRRIFAYAVQMEVRETSPAAHLKDIIASTRAQPMKHTTDPARIGEILLILERAPVLQLATKALITLSPMLFTRPSELREMRWDEISGDLWTIPPERMKKRRALIVPLPRQAQAIIEGMRIHTGHLAHVLANTSSGQPISEGAAQRLKIRQGLHDEITWHGWRHCASTLLNEKGYNRDHIEAQLAHVETSTSRGTYNHAAYLDQRRAMLQDWADTLDELKAQALEREAQAKKAKNI